MFRSGYLTLVRWRGTALCLHWSIPVGAVLFSGFRLNLGSLAGFLVVVCLHELGHAMMVWRFGHEVRAIQVTGFGGLCRWSGDASPFQESAIAWGGVLAQLVLLGGAYCTLWLAGPASAPFLSGVVSAFTTTNLWLIAVNLIPVPPLDGASAWQIFARWRQRRRSGLPHGTWRAPSRRGQRDWLDRAERAGRDRRMRARPVAARAKSEPDSLRSGARPSDDAQREIDALLRRATASVERDDKKS